MLSSQLPPSSCSPQLASPIHVPPLQEGGQGGEVVELFLSGGVALRSVGLADG